MKSMNSHEKLGNLLSQYLSSEQTQDFPSEILDAFHKLSLTEFASRKNVDETYLKMMAELHDSGGTSNKSKYSREYEAQQKKELSDAYTMICEWMSHQT